MSDPMLELSPVPPKHEEALDIVVQATVSLFVHGQTTERTIVTAERLGKALGVPIRVLPNWGELVVEIDGTSLAEINPATPLDVDMGKVLAVMNVVDQVCDGTLSLAAARPEDPQSGVGSSTLYLMAAPAAAAPVPARIKLRRVQLSFLIPATS